MHLFHRLQETDVDAVDVTVLGLVVRQVAASRTAVEDFKMICSQTPGEDSRTEFVYGWYAGRQLVLAGSEINWTETSSDPGAGPPGARRITFSICSPEHPGPIPGVPRRGPFRLRGMGPSSWPLSPWSTSARPTDISLASSYRFHTFGGILVALVSWGWVRAWKDLCCC